MAFTYEVFSSEDWAQKTAAVIADALPGSGTIVLTGGTTAEKVYPLLARSEARWADLDVAFSDERCVHPEDPASNYKMARDLLLDQVKPKAVHRMRGEDPPDLAADEYHSEMAPLVAGGLDVVLLGMGADAHVGAMFPGSMVLEETDRYCRPVDRPDGLGGLTLTPPALLAGKRILLLVTGAGKAETVARVINGNETPAAAPARLLADHPSATFLLDEAAASAL
ncbi:MAG: 6-phosphogluconolactonase [Actinomycetota bacterium]|jgi:6-phosphogluconolactonase|nr:6-phosphogluconolactonase [Actinomycetota bacterium]